MRSIYKVDGTPPLLCFQMSRRLLCKVLTSRFLKLDPEPPVDYLKTKRAPRQSLGNTGIGQTTLHLTVLGHLLILPHAGSVTVLKAPLFQVLGKRACLMMLGGSSEYLLNVHCSGQCDVRGLLRVLTKCTLLRAV